MKKYFETPDINIAELAAVDTIMASAELVKRNGSLAAVKDEAAASSDLWMGADEGWL